jgi:hypothetical protein
MHRMAWAVYLWPGLPQISKRGSWAALLLAVAAAALLNLALLGSFVWPEMLASDLRIICWTSVAVAWSVSAGVSVWSRFRTGREAEDTEPFSRAIDDYLKGNWFESERLLTSLVRRDSHDLEARLMLATLLRHTKRYDEATRHLNTLARLEGAEKWELEIRREGKLITEGRARTITSANTPEAKSGE